MRLASRFQRGCCCRFLFVRWHTCVSIHSFVCNCECRSLQSLFVRLERANVSWVPDFFHVASHQMSKVTLTSSFFPAVELSDTATRSSHYSDDGDDSVTSLAYDSPHQTEQDSHRHRARNPFCLMAEYLIIGLSKLNLLSICAFCHFFLIDHF